MKVVGVGTVPVGRWNNTRTNKQHKQLEISGLASNLVLCLIRLYSPLNCTWKLSGIWCIWSPLETTAAPIAGKNVLWNAWNCWNAPSCSILGKVNLLNTFQGQTQVEYITVIQTGGDWSAPPISITMSSTSSYRKPGKSWAANKSKYLNEANWDQKLH